jgi:xanthine dehydrogenase accessory factor
VVVATHADADEGALERVLATPASYVSLVASRRRGAAILDRLRERGVAAEHLARVKAPAGLDIGAVTPTEIAVSILAEIIQRSAKMAAAGARDAAGGTVGQTRDLSAMQVATAPRGSAPDRGRAIHRAAAARRASSATPAIPGGPPAPPHAAGT